MHRGYIKEPLHWNKLRSQLVDIVFWLYQSLILIVILGLRIVKIELKGLVSNQMFCDLRIFKSFASFINYQA